MSRTSTRTVTSPDATQTKRTRRKVAPATPSLSLPELEVVVIADAPAAPDAELAREYAEIEESQYQEEKAAEDAALAEPEATEPEATEPEVESAAEVFEAEVDAALAEAELAAAQDAEYEAAVAAGDIDPSTDPVEEAAPAAAPQEKKKPGRPAGKKSIEVQMQDLWRGIAPKNHPTPWGLVSWRVGLAANESLALALYRQGLALDDLEGHEAFTQALKESFEAFLKSYDTWMKVTYEDFCARIVAESAAAGLPLGLGAQLFYEAKAERRVFPDADGNRVSREGWAPRTR
jgi:hypothetical protein